MNANIFSFAVGSRAEASIDSRKRARTVSKSSTDGSLAVYRGCKGGDVIVGTVCEKAVRGVNPPTCGATVNDCPGDVGIP